MIKNLANTQRLIPLFLGIPFEKIIGLFFLIICLSISCKTSLQAQDECLNPTIEFQTIDTAQVFLTWSNVSNARNYLVEYRKSTEAQWNKITVEDTVLTVSGLEFCSAYVFRMKTRCTTRESLYSTSIPYATSCDLCSESSYCTFDNIDNSFEWIESISFDNERYRSRKDVAGYIFQQGHTQYAAIQGESYPLVIEPGYLGGDIKKEFYAVWIDYNQNGFFEDVENIVAIDTTIGDSFSTGVSIPPLALPGITRMRVILAFNQAPRACDFNDFVFGEIEDYCIEILESASACDTDIIISSQSVDDHTVMLEWNTNQDAIAYDIRYRNTTESNWTNTISSDQSILITELKNCSNYEFQIRNICGSDTSPYSESHYTDTRCSTTTTEIHYDLHVSPNPCSTHMDIHLPDVESFSLTIMDTTGKIMLQRNGIRNHQIDMNALSPQLYLVQIVTDQGQRFLKKILKE